MPARALGPAERREARLWLCRTVSPYAGERELPDPALWADILDAADRALLLPRLHDELADLHAVLPPDVLDLLQTVYLLNADRNRALLDQTGAMVALFNEAGIVPVLLKGVAVLTAGGPGAASRMMNDIDVWVPDAAEQTAAIALLEAAGYRTETPIAGFRKSDLHHFPPFYHPDRPARIELHHRIIRPSLDGLMDEAAALGRLESRDGPGGRVRLLHHMDALALSYIQSTHMAVPRFEMARVAFMKWLDFLDRVVASGMRPPASRRACGLLGDDTAVDVQFFTALHDYFGFPYAGPRDETYLAARDRRLAEGWLPALLSGFANDAARGKLFRLDSWRRAPQALRSRLRNPRRL